MSNIIICPSCNHSFPMETAMAEEYKKELREKMKDFVRQKEEELLQKTKDFQLKEREWQLKENEKEKALMERFETEKNKLQQNLEATIRKNLMGDFELKMKMLEDNNRDNEEKLKLARQKEIEFLQQVNKLKDKEAELEITLQRKLQDERQKIADEVRKIEEQKQLNRDTDYQLRLKELEKQLLDQKKLAEEMRRKAEQGSTQLQGEVQEIALEALLQQAFPMDTISEVGKGIRGADCIQSIKNSFGQECGRIIYESKRTKNFEKNWIEKLKTDMRSTTSDIAVLVTSVLPDNLNRFGQLDGVWICTFTEVTALANVLRDGMLKIYIASKSQENKGDKMHLLYSYLTSNEFNEQWKAVREGFQSMRASIQKERDAMERLWKAREKQLEKVLLNAMHVKGSIEGIAGQETIDINILEDDNDVLPE